MRREEAEHLIHHHYRLYTQVKSKIDNKPPISMFVSPKSSHYKPFAQRRHRSVEAKRNPRPKGGEELAQFISIKKIPSQSSLSHNIYAKSQASGVGLPSISPSTSHKSLYAHIQPRLLSNRNYQPPLRRPKSPRKNSPATQSLNLPASTSKAATLPQRSYSSLSGSKPRIPSGNTVYRNYELVQRRYREFKEQCLNDILLRGVYSDRVIKDCFYREMERRTDLDYERMHQIMVEALKELGIKVEDKSGISSKKSSASKEKVNPAQAEKRVKIIKEKIQETTGSLEESIEEESQSQTGSTTKSRTGSKSEDEGGSKTNSRKSSKAASASSKSGSESGSVISVHSSQLSTPPGGRSKAQKSRTPSPAGSAFSSIHEDDKVSASSESHENGSKHSSKSSSSSEKEYEDESTHETLQQPSPPRRQGSAATSSSRDFRLDVPPPRLDSASSDDFDELWRERKFPKNEGIDLYDREPSLCGSEDASLVNGSSEYDKELAAIIEYAKKK